MNFPWWYHLFIWFKNKAKDLYTLHWSGWRPCCIIQYITVHLVKLTMFPHLVRLRNLWPNIYNLTHWQATKGQTEAKTLMGGPTTFNFRFQKRQLWEKVNSGGFFQWVLTIAVLQEAQEVSHHSLASLRICGGRRGDSWAIETFYFSVSVEVARLSDGVRPSPAFSGPQRSAGTGPSPLVTGLRLECVEFHSWA